MTVQKLINSLNDLPDECRKMTVVLSTPDGIKQLDYIRKDPYNLPYTSFEEDNDWVISLL